MGGAAAGAGFLGTSDSTELSLLEEAEDDDLESITATSIVVNPELLLQLKEDQAEAKEHLRNIAFPIERVDFDEMEPTRASDVGAHDSRNAKFVWHIDYRFTGAIYEGMRLADEKLYHHIPVKALKLARLGTETIPFGDWQALVQEHVSAPMYQLLLGVLSPNIRLCVTKEMGVVLPLSWGVTSEFIPGFRSYVQCSRSFLGKDSDKKALLRGVQSSERVLLTSLLLGERDLRSCNLGIVPGATINSDRSHFARVDGGWSLCNWHSSGLEMFHAFGDLLRSHNYLGYMRIQPSEMVKIINELTTAIKPRHFNRIVLQQTTQLERLCIDIGNCEFIYWLDNSNFRDHACLRNKFRVSLGKVPKLLAEDSDVMLQSYSFYRYFLFKNYRMNYNAMLEFASILEFISLFSEESISRTMPDFDYSWPSYFRRVHPLDYAIANGIVMSSGEAPIECAIRVGLDLENTNYYKSEKARILKVAKGP